MAATKNIFLSSVLQAVMLGLYIQVHVQHETERCYTVILLPEMTKGKLYVRVIDREGHLEQGISPGPLVY